VPATQKEPHDSNKPLHRVLLLNSTEIQRERKQTDRYTHIQKSTGEALKLHIEQTTKKRRKKKAATDLIMSSG